MGALGLEIWLDGGRGVLKNFGKGHSTIATVGGLMWHGLGAGQARSSGRKACGQERTCQAVVPGIGVGLLQLGLSIFLFFLSMLGLGPCMCEEW